MTRRRWTSTVLLLPLLGAMVPGAGGAATVTVSPGGSIGAELGSAASGDSVLVEAGSYYENVSLVDGVALLGGYDSSFSEATRSRLRNPTVIHGGDNGTTVTSGPGISASTVVEGFVISGGSGDGAAGVRVIGGAPVFINNEISDNRGGVAGGVYISGGSTAMLRANLIRHNASAGSGGGVRVERSAVMLLGNEIRDNIAAHNGGGLYVFQSAAYCSSNAFLNCYSGEGGGGGAYLQTVPSTARFVDNSYFHCTAFMGGGVYAKDESYPTFERETFRNCHAMGNGGGLAATVFSELTVVDCQFDGCRSDGTGGGIYIVDGDLRLLGADATTSSPSGLIRDCSAIEEGGGVAVLSSTAVIDGILVSGCTSDSWGGGLYILHSPATVTRNVVAECVAVQGGGMAFRTVIRGEHKTSDVLNNDVYGCSGTGAGVVGGGVSLAAIRSDNIANFAGNIVSGTLLGAALICPSNTGLPSVHCSSFHADSTNPISPTDVVSGLGCDAAFSGDPSNRQGIDPQFCDPVGSDFRLQSSSPEKGTNCFFGGGKADRGAHPDGAYCSGTVVSVERSSWGEIKAMYR